MTQIEKLQKLASLCAISYSIGVNEYKALYDDPEDYYFAKREERIPSDIDFQEDIWEIRAYFVTPVSFYDFVGNDLDTLLDQAIQLGEEIKVREAELLKPCPSCSHPKEAHKAVADHNAQIVYGYCEGSAECECSMLKDEF